MNKRPGIVIIGGGPGGYVAAIRAAQLGGKVTLVEKGKLGGTCLNIGCIPTKVLLHTAEIYESLQKPGDVGLKIAEAGVDWDKLLEKKEKVVTRLVNGVTSLLKANEVKVVQGTAAFVDTHAIKVSLTSGGSETITGDFFIIATGSEPFLPSIPGIELPDVITSTEALSLAEIPESLLIIGGGVIGVEFASFYASFGCRVTIIEMMPQILSNMDEELVGVLKKILLEKGIRIINNVRVSEITGGEKSLIIKATGQDGQLEFQGEKVLVSVGRKVNIRDLGLEKIGLKLDQDKIVVNHKLQTGIAHIYAIGDCTGINMLAHVASHQGMVAAENIGGGDVTIDYKTVPSCIYTRPEMAGVGLTERQALELGYRLKIGRFPLAANGKSLIMDDTQGLVKIIAEEKHGEILGVQILGPRATDLIAEGALTLRLEATLEEIISTIHAHPTVGEAFLEGALAAEGRAIHIPARLK
ncbi:MAG: dihydrolipoyl dehydrogenase [Peptococcaceae bacterium]